MADNRFPSIRIELNIWTGLPSVLWDPSFFDVFSAIGATLLVVTFDLVHHFGESSNIEKEERQRNSQCTSFLVLSQERHCPFEQSQITPYQKDFGKTSLKRSLFFADHTSRDGSSNRSVSMALPAMSAHQQEISHSLCHLFSPLDDRYQTQYAAEVFQSGRELVSMDRGPRLDMARAERQLQATKSEAQPCTQSRTTPRSLSARTPTRHSQTQTREREGSRQGQGQGQNKEQG